MKKDGGGLNFPLLVIREPKHFSRLILICASPRYLNDEGYRGGFAKSDIDGLYSAVVSSYATWANGFAHLAMRNEERPHLALNFAEALKRIPSEIALTVLCAIFQSDHRADLAKLDKPTLIVQSTNDIAVPMEVAEYLYKNITGSRLRAITASGHLPHVSAPDEIIKVMQDFFDYL